MCFCICTSIVLWLLFGSIWKGVGWLESARLRNILNSERQFLIAVKRDNILDYLGEYYRKETLAVSFGLSPKKYPVTTMKKYVYFLNRTPFLLTDIVQTWIRFLTALKSPLSVFTIMKMFRLTLLQNHSSGERSTRRSRRSLANSWSSSLSTSSSSQSPLPPPP